ncbi:MAG: DUF5655 domain-containing protein [Hyphomicrobiaceae bacterium]|nr:DUF5655 domain-containing protein [Hyphomicrobiaceae bacterium]
MTARGEEEEEREFLAELKARSGQDLAGWMAAITAKGFSDKNETIDWLRTQGFPFARASWLERIHSNGGRPIYLDALPAPVDVAIPEPKLQPVARPVRPIAPPANANEPVAPRAAVAPPPEAADEVVRLEALVAAAKGYRPLYQMLEAMVRQAVPQVVLRARGGLIVFAAPAEFAAVLPTATEIRLGLALGARPHDVNLVPSRLKGAPAGITHMLVLKDARQINAELQSLIAAAQAAVAKAAG